jgi:poly-gamma-glutamate synthesis protein (capsule biosynthesis protein)
MELLIGGDLVPTPSNIDLFTSGDATALFGEELLSIWNNASIRMFNLEVPLTDAITPISKCGPNLIAPTNTVKGIKQLNPTLLTLANNHILDQGQQGLESTKKILTKNEIPFIGIGNNLSEASKSYILKYDEVKVGVYACAEHEFAIATATSAGANPFDLLASLDHVHELKEKCDYVIVLYHGGKEHYRYPSPYLQKVCRRIVEKGADLVVCQHSHCIGASEIYNGSTIVYGQGNFLFDHSLSEFWQTSLLLKVTMTDRNIDVAYIPIVKHVNGVRLADDKSSKKILQTFNERSRLILEDGFVREEYEKFAAQMLNGYLTAFHGNSFLLRVMNKLCGRKLAKKLYSKKALIVLQNFIECEAHRELVLAGLKKSIRS